MAFKFNPFTGTLDVTDTFNPDTILTYLFEVLMDQYGNVLIGA
jgi:hypothetical protein